MDNFMGFRVNGNLILVPKEHLSAYQKQYVNNKFYPLEDKMSELGCMDLLSFLKTLCKEDVFQENRSQNISQNNVVAVNQEPVPWQLLDEKPSFQGGDVAIPKMGARKGERPNSPNDIYFYCAIHDQIDTTTL